MSAEEKPEAKSPEADPADSAVNQVAGQPASSTGASTPDDTSQEGASQEEHAGTTTPEVSSNAKVAKEVPDADVLDFGDAKLGPEQLDEPDLGTDAQDLQAELTEARAKADEHWERVLRMQADMENQRKRAQRDVENARKFALEGIINDLLPVRDSLEMGLAAARETDADPSKIIEGSDLTLKMLAQAFEKYNILVVDPLDEKFDPELHQAMSMQEVEGKDSNTVTGVLQKGYTLNGRLLRPALVMVAK